MGVNEIYDLLKKYRENKCTPLEKERIVDWYQQFDDEAENLPEIPQGKLDQLWCSIETRVKVSSKKRRFYVISRYAAAVILLIASTLVFYYFNKSEGKVMEVAQQEILPAKGVAMLELSDGRQIALNKEETIQEQEGMLIKNNSSQVLDYSLAGKGEIQAIYNTITVPVGGEYQVVLSDGTKVHLNSCSSLTYPVPFTGDTRMVELTGEAYFNVTKAAKPFIVKTSNVDIRVLGTSFNVSGYSEDRQLTMTLVEGHVVVCDKQQKKEYDVIPGMTLSYFKDNGQVKIEEVDPDLYISWMQGKFKFEDMRLEDILVKLNRWYDCKFDYTDNSLRELRFSGAAERDRPAGYLLEMIETVTDVKFKVSGKNILVNRK